MENIKTLQAFFYETACNVPAIRLGESIFYTFSAPFVPLLLFHRYAAEPCVL